MFARRSAVTDGRDRPAISRCVLMGAGMATALSDSTASAIKDGRVPPATFPFARHRVGKAHARHPTHARVTEIGLFRLATRVWQDGRQQTAPHPSAQRVATTATVRRQEHARAIFTGQERCATHVPPAGQASIATRPSA